MKLAELMREDLICTDLSEQSKESVLQALVDQLVDQGEVDNGDEVLRLLLERERLMTTGVRSGFAVPHAFSEHVRRSVVTLGYVADGVDWEALDKKPVRYVFLMLGPPASAGSHLRLLARLSRLLSSQVFVHRLTEAKTPVEMLAVIKKTEAELALDRGKSGAGAGGR
jgi:PTS system nitrogen regulatory IIA component